MTGWTTIPPWLYQNDLADEDLQTVYVTAARKKVAELRRRVRDLTHELDAAEASLSEAEGFLRDAEAALAGYRARRRPPLPARKLLPRP